MLTELATDILFWWHLKSLFLNMQKRFLAIPNRAYLGMALILVSGMFFLLLENQKKATDPGLVLDEMRSAGKVKELANWQVTFLNCDSQRFKAICEPLNDKPIDIVLPGRSEIVTAIEKLPVKPNRAEISYTFSEEERKWIAAKKNINVIIPQTHSNFVREFVSYKTETDVGFLNDAVFFMTSGVLLSREKMVLQFEFSNYHYFGPISYPIAMTTIHNTGKYGRLTTMNIASFYLSKQLEIGIPLLLIGMALILDHSLVFTILAILAFFRSVRFFSAFDPFSYNPIMSSKVAEFMPVIVDSQIVVLILFFTMALFHIKTKRFVKWILPVISFGCFLAFYQLDKDFILKSHLISDMFGSGMAIPLAVWGFIKFFKKKETDAENEIEREMHKNTALSTAVFSIRFVVIAFVLAVTAWVNGADLLILEKSYSGEFLNWAHQALLPGLIIAAFMEIGSTTKKMRVFSEVMVAKALIDKDLQVGKEIQEHLLPVRRGSNDYWAWRAFYFPAVQLAGDWFDIRKIKFADGGEYLLVCLVDVTGHGIGAALMTSTISSHWGLWCSEIEKRNAPKSDEEKEALLVEAPAKVHDGLIALRRNRGCTAGFMLFDNEEGKLTYSMAGHPGVLISRKEKMDYLATAGTRPGFKESSVGWIAKTTLINRGEVVHLFSDGIVPPGGALARWLKQIKRAQKDTDKSLSRQLLGQIKSNRSLFRKDQSLEDDMSLLMLMRIAGQEGDSIGMDEAEKGA